MRPKKRVLVYSPLDMGSTPFVFALCTRGFLAVSTRNEHDFTEAMNEFRPDAVVLFLYSDASPVNRLADLAHGHDARVMIIPRAKQYTWNFVADTVICLGDHGSMERLIDALKTLAARKRGPKKASASVQPAMIEAVSA